MEIPHFNEALGVVSEPGRLINVIYAGAPRARHILTVHSRCVANLALDIAKRCRLEIDCDKVWYAAMLHDIGIIMTDAPGIGCTGAQPYMAHGVLGADMLRALGTPEYAARVAERHTGTGLTPDDIHRQRLPLPTDRTLVPQTLLERLVCYADKFYSKNPERLTVKKPMERVRAEMAKHGIDALARFDALAAEFT